MLGDDQHDRKTARDQMIALALLSVIFLVWIQFFSPPPPVQPPPTATPETVQNVVIPEDLVNSVLDPIAPVGSEEPAVTLPESAEAAEAAEVVLEDEKLRLTFTTLGARLKGAEVLLGEEHGGVVEQLVPEADPTKSSGQSVYPLGILFSDPAIHDNFNKIAFEITGQTSDQVTFRGSLPGVGTLEKVYSLTPDRPQVVTCDLRFTYEGGDSRRLGVDDTPAFLVSWAPNVDSRDETKLVRPAIVWRAADVTEVVHTKDMKPDDDGMAYKRVIPGVEWLGRRSAYYVVAFRGTDEGAQGRFAGLSERYAFGIAKPSYMAEQGKPVDFNYELYIGPNTQKDLAAAWPTLPTALRFFSYPDLLDSFSKFLLRVLNWIHATVFNSYGVAIILLTFAVRLLMFPLTIKQVRSMKRMQALSPEMERIKAEHADDPAKQQEEIMKMWRERNVNPLGGCLPLVFQMPVFIALYRMLSSAYELRGAQFLWITDLSAPDHLFKIPGAENLPFIGNYFEYFNLLPLLGALAMVLSVRLSPQQNMAVNPQQKMMMTVMPVVFSFMFYNWASGLNLYVLTSTIMGVTQTHLLRLIDDKKVEPEAVKKRPQRKRQHWYAAAVAKKKQLEKEMNKGNGANKGAKAKAGTQRNRKDK